MNAMPIHDGNSDITVAAAVKMDIMESGGDGNRKLYSCWNICPENIFLLFCTSKFSPISIIFANDLILIIILKYLKLSSLPTQQP